MLAFLNDKYHVFDQRKQDSKKVVSLNASSSQPNVIKVRL